MAYRTRVLRNGIVTVMQAGDGERWNHGFTKRIERRARMLAPKRTTRLAASHSTVRAVGSNQYVNRYRVQADADHAAFVHEGTGIHGPKARIIRRPNGGAMGPISWLGTPRFIRSSKGQRANPWLARAAEIETALL